ncbi:aldehyde-activating protein [Tardiphaga alba]|uniref:Aldehyde-activating protein n=1 Tax=Tardiphaga alba TaxID=340268 RepID=A0ABX8A7R1_9BRAD|nr:GFA family protein [Tardiphaga alba]QUS39779.1 aldehyde-activating protein [Tardiphaga alba]
MILSCPCNAVQIRLSADPISHFWCHCADCQTVHGAAYVAEAIYPADGVELVSGDTTTFTLKRTPRVNCAKCSTRVLIELPEIGMRSVSGYLLKEAFAPTLHIHCSSAVAPVKDGLPHYANMPAAFGGDDKLVDW